MSILFVLEHYYPYIGGAETLFIQLAESLAKKGWKVTVVTTRFRQDLPAKEERLGVDIIRINCGNRFLFSLLSLPTILREAKQADFIHTTTYNAALPAWLAARLSNKTVVVTFHELWGGLWFRLPFMNVVATSAFYAFEQLLLRLDFDYYIAVSKFTQRRLREYGICATKIVQIYNGIEYDKFNQINRINPENFTFTYFGRLGVSKGLDLLLPAAARFLEVNPDSRFNLIVPRRPSGMYKRIIAWQSGLQEVVAERVSLLHELPEEELWRTIATSSCVMIPSYSEGFCFVAVETAALGTSIISSGRAALAETVSGNYLEMKELTTDELLRLLELAKQEKWEFREVRKFDLADSVVAYRDFYRGAIE